jgi:hypothetical protein
MGEIEVATHITRRSAAGIAKGIKVLTINLLYLVE